VRTTNHRWIVTFDVTSDSDRRAIHQLLGRHGIRILYTVYDIEADNAAVDILVEQLRPHIKPSDHLLMLPYCDACRTATLGPAIERHPAHTWIAT
jgi:CRISPR-associated endonuclease Cas2